MVRRTLIRSEHLVFRCSNASVSTNIKKYVIMPCLVTIKVLSIVVGSNFSDSPAVVRLDARRVKHSNVWRNAPDWICTRLTDTMPQINRHSQCLSFSHCATNKQRTRRLMYCRPTNVFLWSQLIFATLLCSQTSISYLLCQLYNNVVTYNLFGILVYLSQWWKYFVINTYNR